MGKRVRTKKTHTHTLVPNTHREETRIILTISFLIRQRAGINTNTANLDDPQPLTELDVQQYLGAIIRTAQSGPKASGGGGLPPWRRKQQ